MKSRLTGISLSLFRRMRSLAFVRAFISEPWRCHAFAFRIWARAHFAQGLFCSCHISLFLSPAAAAAAIRIQTHQITAQPPNKTERARERENRTPHRIDDSAPHTKHPPFVFQPPLRAYRPLVVPKPAAAHKSLGSPAQPRSRTLASSRAIHSSLIALAASPQQPP